MKIKKYIITAFVVLGFLAYALYRKVFNVPAPVSSQQNNAVAESTNSGSGNTTPGQTYKDGQYTGDLADAFFGKVQVVAVISNGKLADVQVPVYPSDRPHTQQLSTQSLPVLKAEAIKSQSAKVDVVTGATQTSQGFMQSLQSALVKAQN
jgi:uncharacterized protein with FMN-binding domain